MPDSLLATPLSALSIDQLQLLENALLAKTVDVAQELGSRLQGIVEAASDMQGAADERHLLRVAAEDQRKLAAFLEEWR